MARYEVYVGNIGNVYSGANENDARKQFNEYVRQSKTGYGRAGWESVTWFDNGEIKQEFIGKVDRRKDL